MTSLHRVFCAFALMLAALAPQLQPVRAADDSSSPATTLAMVTPAPLDRSVVAPPLAQPVLLCGNRWVTGTYVLANNCRKACVNKHHAGCTPALVNQCMSCWRALMQCARQTGMTPQAKCTACSERYAACMSGFL